MIRLLTALAVIGAFLPAQFATGRQADWRTRALASGRLSAEVLKSIDANGATPIIVRLHEPGKTAARSSHAEAAAKTFRIEQDQLLATLAPNPNRSFRRLKSLPIVALTASAADLEKIADNNSVARILVDRAGTGALGQAVPFAQLDHLHDQGLTGANRKVVIVDSGIDSDHPMLQNLVLDEACFCQRVSSSNTAACCPDGSAEQTGPGSAEDDHGHGTHVAGIVAAAGNSSLVGGAPDSGLVIVKALSRKNYGLASDWLAALEWVATNHPDAIAVNLSLGIPSAFPPACETNGGLAELFADVTRQLRNNGTLVVAATHNQGFTTGVALPACVSDVLAVGASYDADLGNQFNNFGSYQCTDEAPSAGQITCFSNTSASVDLVAPGAPILSTWRENQTRVSRGTSMATPLVSACAAVLSEQDSQASVLELERVLTRSGRTALGAEGDTNLPLLDCANSSLELAGCAQRPLEGCIESRNSLLRWRTGRADRSHRFVWKWIQGDAIALDDLSAPDISTRYELCVYDQSQQILMQKRLPAGQPWRDRSRGRWSFTDGGSIADGMRRVRLIPGPAGRSRLQILAGGRRLDSVPEAAAGEIVTQFVDRDTGFCLESRFPSAGQSRPSADYLVARSSR